MFAAAKKKYATAVALTKLGHVKIKMKGGIHGGECPVWPSTDVVDEENAMALVASSFFKAAKAAMKTPMSAAAAATATKAATKTLHEKEEDKLDNEKEEVGEEEFEEEVVVESEYGVNKKRAKPFFGQKIIQCCCVC